MSTVNTVSLSPSQEESDALKLQGGIEQLKVELADFQENLLKLRKREILLAHLCQAKCSNIQY